MLKNLHFYRVVQNLGAVRLPRSHARIQRAQVRPYSGSLYEPDYLESGKSQIPLYDVLNIQIKGYDYPILENYQKYVHSMMDCFGVEVEDSWATPPKNLHIQKFKTQSTVVDGDYKLSVYERNIQIADVPATVYPVILNVLTASLPQGVTLNVHEHMSDHDEVRYVPDLELKDLKNQLDDMGGPSKQKK